jgi:proteasome beta subunit
VGVLFRGRYSGSSFSELLEVDFPQLRAESSYEISGSRGAPEIPHGTTVLAMRYQGGVLMAGDRLATAGHMVASRDMEKVYMTDAHSLVAIAGAAGPAMELARLLRIELEHYEKIEGEPLELEGKANKLSQMVRANLPAAMQGMVVVPVFAGYDLRRHMGRLWKYDVTGGRYEEAEFETSGSGGIYAKESLKKAWRPGLSSEDAIQIALQALTDAADEDRATGGVDLARGIYPIVKLATASGVEDVSEATLRQVYRERIEIARTRAVAD